MVVEELGGPEQLTLRELPDPEPGPDDVVIEVHAAGLNFPDVLMIAGQYQAKPDLPFTPGFEVAGVIRSVGEQVTTFASGERVMATPQQGGYADVAVTHHGSVFPLAAGLTFAEGAAIPIVYGTAHHALADRGQLQPGESLLVTGAAGGVGLAAVQVGKKLGATVIAAVGSAAKADVVADNGADHVINYRDTPLRDRVKELTNGAGADVIFEPVGGEIFDAAVRSVAWRGRLLVIGFASGAIPQFPTNLALVKGFSLIGVFWGSFAGREPDRNRANFDELATWFASGDLHVNLHDSYPLERAAEALELFTARQVAGKLVLDTGR